MANRIPIEEAATRAEVEAAIRSVSKEDKLRLEKYAWYKAIQVGYPVQELVQESMNSILDTESRRRWRKDKGISFVTFFKGAIRSIASSKAKQRTRRPEFLVLEAASSDPIEQARSFEANPERAQVCKDSIQRIRQTFVDDVDQLVLDIIDGFAAGMTRADIIEVLGGDEKSYDTAARRLRRRAKVLFPEGGV